MRVALSLFGRHRRMPPRPRLDSRELPSVLAPGAIAEADSREPLTHVWWCGRFWGGHNDEP